jgi:hypothetical protein
MVHQQGTQAAVRCACRSAFAAAILQQQGSASIVGCSPAWLLSDNCPASADTAISASTSTPTAVIEIRIICSRRNGQPCSQRAGRVGLIADENCPGRSSVVPGEDWCVEGCAMVCCIAADSSSQPLTVMGRVAVKVRTILRSGEEKLYRAVFVRNVCCVECKDSVAYIGFGVRVTCRSMLGGPVQLCGPVELTGTTRPSQDAALRASGCVDNI